MAAIIDHNENRDCLRLFRVYPAILLARNRFVTEFKHKPPVNEDEIHNKILALIATGLMPPIRRMVGTGTEPGAARSFANPVVGEESTEQGKALFRLLELQEMTGIGHDGVINAKCLAVEPLAKSLRRVNFPPNSTILLG